MDIDPQRLPEDPALLRQMVTSLVQEVEARERRLRQLQHWLEQLLRARYGPRRERVNEEACQKYACSKGCTVITAAKPMAPIEKGLAGPGLLAQVAVSKYGDHLPLHRQAETFRRQGVELSRQTMCDWMRACADLVSPLFELMKQRVLGSKAVQTDDTPVPVLDPDLPRTRTGRIWTGYENFVGNIGGVLAPIATGFLIARTGTYLPGFALAAGVLVTGIFAYWFIVGELNPSPLSDPQNVGKGGLAGTN